MSTKKTMYVCNVCGEAYGTRKAADRCEKSHTMYTMVSVAEYGDSVVQSTTFIPRADDGYFLRPTFIYDGKLQKYKWAILVKDPTEDNIKKASLTVLASALSSAKSRISQTSDSIRYLTDLIDSKKRELKEEEQQLEVLAKWQKALEQEQQKYLDDDKKENGNEH